MLLQAGDDNALAAAWYDSEAGLREATTVEEVKHCTFGDPRSSTVVALIGDSHAQHWLAGFDVAGRPGLGGEVDPIVALVAAGARLIAEQVVEAPELKVGRQP